MTSQRTYKRARKAILVVDDDEEMRTAIDIALSPKYDVTLAVDGIDGCAKANEQPRPDLIIADLYMPRLDGIAMVHRIRKDHTLCSVPVIFMSGKMLPAGLVASLSVGTFAYLPKPASGGLLENAVKRSLGQ
jgi:CheY-like chemotaxis protein